MEEDGSEERTVFLARPFFAFQYFQTHNSSTKIILESTTYTYATGTKLKSERRCTYVYSWPKCELRYENGISVREARKDTKR